MSLTQIKKSRSQFRPLFECSGGGTVRCEIVIVLKRHQLSLQITSTPERNLIEVFSTNRADQSFDKWMQQRNVWHGLHLRHIENPEIGVPLAKQKQRIVMPRGQAARSVLRYRGGLDPLMMLLNSRQTAGPSSLSAWTAKPTIRRLN